MKKFLGLGLLAIAFVSCSDDDAAATSTVDAGHLAKKWYFHSYFVNGNEIPYTEPECADSYLEFKSDNTTVAYEVFSCDGTTPVATTDYGTYSVNGNQLTSDFYDDGEGNNVVTITELTETTFKVTYVDHHDDESFTYIEVLKSTPQ
ncbi:hypothetical protein AM493_12140 [Flavobacterium akiainvivens]|uniref:Lipocalin-like domain-containing protein n=1 Tax=Flavobacterium akiainvivens TaxID=1202724 RepID=A0A0M9VII4_9FLAO|nr:lipocalin family protein [Flavobacterium akiainvivens]KOS06700.1 hypothetical protein AM493_12140 [Flavobacterium akiainvivens]SFQ71027.1 Lipocalin-like domain-containing protein [Flavobacterium akiainvivens]